MLPFQEERIDADYVRAGGRIRCPVARVLALGHRVAGLTFDRLGCDG